MDIIATHAGHQPERLAIADGDRAVTWAELLTLRNRLARSLAARGLGADEHVVLWAENSLEYLLAAAAVRALGALPVAMNHRLIADEVQYILDDADAAIVFMARRSCRPPSRCGPRR